MKCPNETGDNWFNRIRECLHGTTDYAKQLIDDSNKLSPPECYKHALDGVCKLMKEMETYSLNYYNCSIMMQEALPDIEHCEIVDMWGIIKSQKGETLTGIACGKIYLTLANINLNIICPFYSAPKAPFK